MQLRLDERYHELFWRWMKNEEVEISDDLHDKFIDAEHQLELSIQTIESRSNYERD